MSSRIYAYVVSLVIVAATAWPIERHPFAGDSFPLSTYPMFSRSRKSAVLSASYAVGVGPGGVRKHLGPRFVANNVEVLQARAILDRTIGSGDRRLLAELCNRIADRVARSGASQIDEVRIVTGTHDAVKYLTGRDRVGRERVHARCRVPKESR